MEHAWLGVMCDEGESHLSDLIDGYLNWSSVLGAGWSGLAFLAPAALEQTEELINGSLNNSCNTTWSFNISYNFIGTNESQEFQTVMTEVAKQMPGSFVRHVQHFDNWWQRIVATSLASPLNDGTIFAYQIPRDSYSDLFMGIVPSAAISTDVARSVAFADQVKANMARCKFAGYCARHEFYHDIPGITTPFPQNLTSISGGFRDAMFHLVIGGADAYMMNSFYNMAPNSYFGESAFVMDEDSWKTRYWGTNYANLVSVKNMYDPDNVFWCHHCVGSDLPRVRREASHAARFGKPMTSAFLATVALDSALESGRRA